MNKEILKIGALLCFFLALGFGIHKDALRTPLFWDDEVTIINNVFIREVKFIKQIFTSGYHAGAGEITNLYRPLANLSFLIEYHIYGLNSAGYHTVNLCLHIINAFLIFFILLSLFKDKRPAAIGVLLFLVHPIATTVLNYASHRPELLMTLFLAASFLSYIKSIEKNSKMLLALSSVFFILSIFSKEMGLILPLFLLLYHRAHRKDLRSLLPFIAITLAYVALRATFLNFLNINIITQGAQAHPYSKNILERLLIFSKIFFTYLKILFVPINLHMDRDVPLLKSSFEVGALAKTFLLIAIIAFLIKNRRRRFSLWTGWFMLGLIPVSGIIPINTAIAEHYLYMPSIGFFAASGWLLWSTYLRLKTKTLQILMKVAGVILFIILGFLSTTRNKEWNEPLALYLSTVNNAQYSFRCTNNAGVEYFKRGSLQTAEYYFKESLKILPTYSPALNNMGVILQRKGQIDKAIDLYKKSIEYKRDYLLAYRNLYGLYLKLARTDEAKDILERLLEIFPYDKDAQEILAKIKTPKTLN